MKVAWKQVGVPGFGIQTRVFLELASGGTFGGTYIRHIEYSVIFSISYLSDANSVGRRWYRKLVQRSENWRPILEQISIR